MSEIEKNISAAGYRLLRIIWENEPMPSSKLVKLAEAELGWKKSTTFTMLKRLSEAGYCVNNDSVVTSLVGPEEIEKQSCHSVAEMAKTRFGDSLLNFITAFVKSEELSKEDTASIIDMLKDYIDDSEN